ncbi:MAG TPA: hypothetical protein VG498_04500 [Terriglobales bacterium]|nr:hypothetical protein [Terriglobales bacterium]
MSGNHPLESKDKPPMEQSTSLRLKKLEDKVNALERLVSSEENPHKAAEYKNDLHTAIDTLRAERNHLQVQLFRKALTNLNH